MRILFGIDGIFVEGVEVAPTAAELCEMDKRLLYVGTVKDKYGNMLHDAFMHVLRPTELYTIKETKETEENVFRLDIERHYFDEKSPIFRYLCDNNAGEIYVGDICDGTGYTGEVWHDAYKFGLDSKILYTKNEKGLPVVIEPPEENIFSVPDRFGFRVTVKTPNKPDKDYAFFYGISAFSKWTYLKYHADKDQEVLHSLDPNYKKFLYYDEVDSFEKYPELVKAYPECYSREGFLDLENYGRKESSNLKR